MIKCKLNMVAGGIFSKYIFGIKNAILHEADSYYLNVSDTNRTDCDIFDCVLDQTLSFDTTIESNNVIKDVDCQHLGNYSKFNPIENSPNLPKYSEIIKKFKIKKELLDEVKYYQDKFNIDESTVGVHIRLTDMNIVHGNDYGVLTFEDFKSKMRPDVKYFVASDNNESLKKLKDLYGDNINYVDGLIRGELESDDTSTMFLNNPVVFKNKQFWHDSFLEMLLLSKCSELICRTSDLSNVAIIYSETIKNVIRL
jgi:hypothetical protein